MKFKTLVYFNSALALVSGLLCVVAPSHLLANYGLILPPIGLVIYQFWGATLIGVGLLGWAVRNVTQTAVQRGIALALLITNGLSCVMAVRGQTAGANNLGWSTVALYGLLTLAWGMFLVVKLRKV